MAGGLKEYYVVNGRALGQELAPGATRVDFTLDAIGSVTGEVNTDGSVGDTYRYGPFGNSLLATTGETNPDFQWNGANQYYDTLLPHAEYYVRARNYSSTEGRWTTADPGGLGLSQAGYPVSNPLSGPASRCILPTRWSYQWRTSCSASCRLGCLCSYNLHGIFDLFVHYTGDCNSCKFYQWAKEDSGPWERDSACGWPITNSPGNCASIIGRYPNLFTFHDTNGQRGNDTPCSDHGHYWQFITCICCGTSQFCVYRTVLLITIERCSSYNCIPLGPTLTSGSNCTH